MATFQEQLKRSKNLNEKKLSRDLFNFIRTIEPEIVKLNVDQINKDSKDIFGNPIGFYSYWTEVLTNGRKKQGEPFDGDDTGKWLKSFYLDVQGEAFRIFATDPKTHIILDSDYWLSDDLFGLSDKNLKELIKNRLTPFFIKNIRKILEI